jgi:hypothetical protein
MSVHNCGWLLVWFALLGLTCRKRKTYTIIHFQFLRSAFTLIDTLSRTTTVTLSDVVNNLGLDFLLHKLIFEAFRKHFHDFTSCSRNIAFLGKMSGTEVSETLIWRPSTLCFYNIWNFVAMLADFYHLTVSSASWIHDFRLPPRCW